MVLLNSALGRISVFIAAWRYNAVPSMAGSSRRVLAALLLLCASGLVAHVLGDEETETAGPSLVKVGFRAARPARGRG